MAENNSGIRKRDRNRLRATCEANINEDQPKFTTSIKLDLNPTCDFENIVRHKKFSTQNLHDSSRQNLHDSSRNALVNKKPLVSRKVLRQKCSDTSSTDSIVEKNHKVRQDVKATKKQYDGWEHIANRNADRYLAEHKNSNQTLNDNNNSLKKAKLREQRLDETQNTLTFNSVGEIEILKLRKRNEKIETITNFKKPTKVNEGFIKGKHLFIVESKYSELLPELVKILLPSSYITPFNDICLFKQNGSEVLLRGPFILPEIVVQEKNVEKDEDKIYTKHIWVFDCPKIRDKSGNLKYEDFMAKDPFVKAFGFPPPEMEELEGLEILVKLAENIDGKILSADTGQILEVDKTNYGFKWETRTEITPKEIVESIKEVLDSTEPTVFDENLESIFNKKHTITFQTRCDNEKLTKIFRPQKYATVKKNCCQKWQTQNLYYMATHFVWNYEKLVDKTSGIELNSNNDYSFKTQLGMYSEISIQMLSENFDINYDNKKRGIKKITHYFTWLPKNYESVTNGISSYITRERLTSLIVLEHIANNLVEKFGGDLLDFEGLPLIIN